MRPPPCRFQVHSQLSRRRERTRWRHRFGRANVTDRSLSKAHVGGGGGQRSGPALFADLEAGDLVALRRFPVTRGLAFEAEPRLFGERDPVARITAANTRHGGGVLQLRIHGDGHHDTVPTDTLVCGREGGRRRRLEVRPV